MDEEGQPISRGKKKRTVVHTDKALQEAQDVFGVDFDFAEFDDYNSGDEEEDEEVNYWDIKSLDLKYKSGCTVFLNGYL